MKFWESKTARWVVVLLMIGSAGWYMMVPSPPSASLTQEKMKVTEDHEHSDLKRAKSIREDIPSSADQPRITVSSSKISSKSHIPSAARETVRRAALQKQKEHREARERYKRARKRWRKELNQAFQQAKKDGDYTMYNMIKEQEPDKAYFLK